MQKFKRLIEPENATPMQSILGQDVEPHFVQPPLSMDASDVELPSGNTTDQNALSSARSIHSKSCSTDSRRRVVEKGIYMHPTMQKSGSASRLASTHGESCSGTCQHSAASTTQSPCPTPLQTSRTNTPSKQSFSEGTRGHARDPLEEDHSFLFIGPSTFTGVLTLEDEKTSSNYFSRAVAPHAATVPIGNSEATSVLDGDSGGFSISEMDLVPIVSESPGASDIDIYETAYTEEVERIRKQSLTRQRRAPRVYLTRRVEGKESSLGELLRRATADVTAAVAADKKGPSAGLAQIVAVISSTTTTTTTAAAIPPAQNQEIATVDETTQVSMAATTTGPSTDLASQIQSQDADASADARPKAELEATIATVFSEPTMQGSEQQPAQDPTPSPTSSTPSLSHKTSGAAVAVTGTINATAATATTPTTQRSRTSLRSLLGRVRRESTQFGKK